MLYSTRHFFHEQDRDTGYTMLLAAHTADSHNNLPVIDDLQRTHSVSQVRLTITRLHSLFALNQLKEGDAIVLLMQNRCEFIEVVLAALSAGLCVIPFNWHLSAAERNTLLLDSGAKLLVSEIAFSNTLEECPLPVMYVEHHLHTSTEKRVLPQWNGSEKCGSIMIYTGGTTGLPKAVKRATFATLAGLVEQFKKLGISSGLDGKGTHLVTGPLYHAAPLYFALYDFLNGARLLLMPRWDTEQVLRLIELRQVTHLHLVPTQMVRLLRLDSAIKQKYSAASVQLMLHGAAPVSRAIKEQMLTWCGAVLVEYWGGSESGICTRIDSHDWLKKPGSVGKPIPQYTVQVVDPETYLPLPAGVTGLLLMRHESGVLPYQYHGVLDKKPDSNSDNYSDNYPAPWFDLGDMGYQDDEGYVFLSDRDKNKIISGGVNIYPAEIESLLLAMDCIQDVVVLGMADEEWGEKVVAVLELTSAMDDGMLLPLQLQLQEKMQNLARFKQPGNYYIVESLERLPTGKIKLANVREMILTKGYVKHFRLG